MTAQNLLKSTGKKNLKASLGEMDYNQVLKYLDELELFGIKLGLNNITALCELLGNPQLSYKTIHVAGTNGKGSVVAMVSSILREAGYKAGMYTSPHLQTFRERIQINGEMIKQKEMVEIFAAVKEASDRLKEKGMQVTYFEFTTAIAFLYFKKKKCDFVVIEVGMGGRLDATNIIKPLAAAITNIELEHTEYLGDTKEKIAMEKAGIIKENGLLITGERDEKILQLLKDVCNKKNSEIAVVEKDYDKEVLLTGKHQKMNAAIAFATIKSLENSGINISNSDIENGIANTKWHGRLEVVQENPRVILDGTHNPPGAITLADYLKNLDKEIIMVIGISDDKDIAKMMQTLAPLAKKIFLTRAKHRGTDCEILKKEAIKYNKNLAVVEDVREAVKAAIKEAKDEIVMVTGSLFVAGAVRGLWFDEKP